MWTEDDEMSEAYVYVCIFCEDTGMEYPDCETCGGWGWIEDPEDGGTMTCPECAGEPCHVCNGDCN